MKKVRSLQLLVRVAAQQSINTLFFCAASWKSRSAKSARTLLEGVVGGQGRGDTNKYQDPLAVNNLTVAE